MATNKIQIEDHNGDIYYPHTSADVVKRGTSTVDADLKSVENKFNAQGAALGAVQLAAARTINGTPFNGTDDITTNRWGISRDIQIGNSKKPVNGSANVTWSLAEIGAITKIEILNMFFPVGTIHFTTQNVNPGTTMGGTWVAWGSGRVPVGVNTGDTSFNTTEKTGGSKTMRHKHGHGDLSANIGSFDYDVTSIGYHAGPVISKDGFSYGFHSLPNAIRTVSNDRINHNVPVYGETDLSAENESSTLQPYITCYMWKRTA